jgi:cytochrome c-type biogenesis protein
MIAFEARACPICRRMEPLVLAAEKSCAGHGVRVQRVEVDRAGGRELAKRFGVLGVPTYLFVDAKGNEIARLVGEQPLAILEQSIEVLSGRRCAGFRAFPEPPAS